MSKLKSSQKNKFSWDKDIADNTELLNDIEIFSRILNYGNLDEIKILIKEIGLEKIKKFVINYPYKLNKRSLSFWEKICGIKKSTRKAEKGIRNSIEIWNY